MSTPIETNTEELQEILQQVYDLPDRSSGGSGDPDLVITPYEDFRFYPDDKDHLTYNIAKISFDPSAVVSAYEKLIAGEDVRAAFVGNMYLNSYSPKIMTAYSALRVLAYGTDVSADDSVYLVVRFMGAAGYFFLSNDNGWRDFEYRFRIRPNTGEVLLDGAKLWQ